MKTLNATNYKERIDAAYKTRIQKPLVKAISYELKNPGELLDYLTYLHIRTPSSWGFTSDKDFQ